ncbi:MAG: sugar ABC transporter ATP-binding protein [Acidimicrobiales bacterium]|jgi:ABC-type sugar transport system ATPase subunit
MPGPVGAENLEGAAGDSPAPDEAIRVRDLNKSFGETRALRGCSLDVLGGEIHAVIGENGSGKSTLVKVLSGVIFPDSGAIEVGGATAMRRLRTPRIARELGIATVFQEILVVDPISVLANIWLGMDGDFRTRVGLRQKRAEAAEVLASLVEHPPDLDTPVELLDLAARQVVVLARALVQHPRVLILDEATSALDVSARDRLFEVVHKLAREGTATIFISHRMDEIVEIADRATVLRGGASVGTLARTELEPSRILELMSGEGEVLSRRRSAHELGEVFLEVEGVGLRPGGQRLDTLFHRGEIVGLAGLEGHGQEQFIRALAGIEQPATGRVLRRSGQRAIPVVSQRQAARLGIAYVPRDRKLQGVFEPLSILDNFSLPTIRRDRTAGGLISDRRRRNRLNEFVKRLKIRLASPRHAITSLSGGNQQKVVIARWLAMKPELLVLDDPTRGIDVGAKKDLYELLGELATEGVAIIMLSTEIEEHIALMDRVLVFREGELFVDIPREQLTRERLIAGFFGQAEIEETAV